jgi:hypothetical protein
MRSRENASLLQGNPVKKANDLGISTLSVQRQNAGGLDAIDWLEVGLLRQKS